VDLGWGRGPGRGWCVGCSWVRCVGGDGGRGRVLAAGGGGGGAGDF
jgi:hypothetical protein